MARSITALCILVLSISACTHSKIAPDAANEIHKEGIIRLWVAWLKDKGDKFDMNLNIVNANSNEGMIIMLSDITCNRGGVPGIVKHTFFNTGERTIDFRPSETKSFNLFCRFGADVKGDYSVTIRKIYANPSLDGKTVGKVVAEDIVWRQAERRE